MCYQVELSYSGDRPTFFDQFPRPLAQVDSSINRSQQLCKLMPFMTSFLLKPSQVLVLSQVEELQFSLAKGRWSHDWGFPSMSVPSGAFVRAWQSPALTEQEQRHHFRDMVHGLAGLTGTALSTAAEQDDMVAWQPATPAHVGERIASSNSYTPESDVLSAFLPWESSCTENLQVQIQPCASVMSVWPYRFAFVSAERLCSFSLVFSALVAVTSLPGPESGGFHNPADVLLGASLRRFHFRCIPFANGAQQVHVCCIQSHGYRKGTPSPPP
jgi:hypothetical protein